MRIKWVEDELVETTLHCVVGKQRIGTISKSVLKEEYIWFSPIIPTDAQGRQPSLDKAKMVASKSWHGFLKRCGYRAPRPLRPRRKFRY